MLDLLLLTILALIGIIAILFIALNRKVQDLDVKLKKADIEYEAQLSEMKEETKSLRDELFNVIHLYVDDREMLEDLHSKESGIKGNNCITSDEKELKQLIETKEKLISEVEVFRQRIIELDHIEDPSERIKSKREIESGMLHVQEQIEKYQKLEKKIITNIVERKKDLLK